MSFTSWQFAIFLPTVFVLFHLVPGRFKFWIMLLASWYFYMSWQPIFILVLLYSTLVSYGAAFPIHAAKSDHSRKIWLWIGVTATLAPLVLFKYFNFINEQIAQSVGLTKVVDVTFTLPVGISFFTFQALSYLIDVYRRDVAAESSFSVYALYKAFFPQLVAGPIERATHLLPQMAELARSPTLQRFKFNDQNSRDGLRLILWGLFKKLAIADNLAVIVSEIFDGNKAYSGPMLLIGAYFFAYQIYCDFSGYTDIARGCAKLFGFDLMHNFRSPYRARSIQEFWQRWHISLSTWFRDYVYRPLGGSRVSFARWVFNILVVFLLSGIWHGANWTFLVWGALHGSYYICGRLTEKLRRYATDGLRLTNSPPWHVVQIVITFHLVVLAWVFFRASDIGSAIDILAKILGEAPRAATTIMADILAGRAALNSGYWAQALHVHPSQFAMIWNGGTLIVISMVIVLETVDFLRERTKLGATFLVGPIVLRWGAYYALAVATLVVAPLGSKQFIYFQF
jgi:D-alanyl-lipoteichoic acid acyltransferase DltB (MBOAT superfamily)